MRRLLPIALGILGFTLAWGAWHLYLDHQALHQIWALELQRAQAVAAGAK